MLIGGGRAAASGPAVAGCPAAETTGTATITAVTVALATAHRADVLPQGAATTLLPAASVQATGGSVEIIRAPCGAVHGLVRRVRYSDWLDCAVPLSGLLAAMTTTSNRTPATEAYLTPGARCMCRMCDR